MISCGTSCHMHSYLTNSWCSLFAKVPNELSISCRIGYYCYCCRYCYCYYYYYHYIYIFMYIHPPTVIYDALCSPSSPFSGRRNRGPQRKLSEVFNETKAPAGVFCLRWRGVFVCFQLFFGVTKWDPHNFSGNLSEHNMLLKPFFWVVCLWCIVWGDLPSAYFLKTKIVIDIPPSK